MAEREITAEEQQTVTELVTRARAAMAAAESFDQAGVDRLCRAVAWAGGNLATATRLAEMSVAESGMGSPEPSRRGKVLGILRDALRQKSMGVIEELPEKGIVKYAKPAGVIAGLIPVTSPYVTPIGIAIYALKCRDAVIFAPHPGSRRTTNETVRLLRAALQELGAPVDLLQCVEKPSIPVAQALIFAPHPGSRRTTNETVRLLRAALQELGAPVDLLQCVEKPSIPVAQALMSSCDLTIATGGPPMVRAAYSSGKPAYGVGAGNATMVIDDSADVAEAAKNSAISKTNDHGSGCSADGNLVVDSSIYDALLARLQAEGGYVVNAEEKELLRKVYWDEQGRRTADTIARPAQVVAQKAGFSLPAGKTFLIVPEDKIGKAHPFSTEKLGIVLAVFRYSGFDMALDIVRRIFETGGRGHSCGIYSFNDDHINRLALMAPVSRITVSYTHLRAHET